MIIQNNLMSVNSFHHLNMNNREVSKDLRRLATGLKINSAADDASGLCISQKMRRQIHALSVAQDNLENGLGLSRTADGALEEVNDIIIRLKELALKSINGTYQDLDRSMLQQEVDSLVSEVDRIAYSTEFNGNKPLLYESKRTEYIEHVITEVISRDITHTVETVFPPIYDADPNYSSVMKSITVNTRADRKGQYQLHMENDTYVYNGRKDDYIGASDVAGTKVRLKKADGTMGVYTLKDTAKITVDNFRDVPGGKITGKACDFTINDADNGFHFKITQIITAVSDTEGDTYGEYFNVQYDFQNLDNDKVTCDVLMGVNPLHTTTMRTGSLVKDVEKWNEAGNKNQLDSKQLLVDLKTNDLEAYQYRSEDDSNRIMEITMLLKSDLLLKKPDYFMQGYPGDGTRPDYFTFDSIDHLITGTVPPGQDYHVGMAWMDNEMDDSGKFSVNALIGTVFPHGTNIVTPGRTETTTTTETITETITRVEIEEKVTGRDPIWIQAGTEKRDGFHLFECDARAEKLGIKNLSIQTAEEAEQTLQLLKVSQDKVSQFRGNFGADMNRIEHAQNVDAEMHEDLTVSESRLRDLDMAKTMMSFTKSQILSRSAQSMLAQANTYPQFVLKLIQ